MSVPDFSLIETMRYVAGEGILRRPLHLKRLEKSARSLGFEGASGIEEALHGYLRSLDGDMFRVRLELAPDGAISITSAPFSLQAADTVWRLAFADTRASSSDRLLRHKTTRRGIYDTARAEFSTDVADEVILLNEKGEVCEGTITNLFLDDGSGTYLTPPLSAGCLDGVLRKSLVQEGKAVEQALGPDDLVGRTLYIGNSLRGLIRARLQDFAG